MSVNSRKMLLAAGFGNAIVPPPTVVVSPVSTLANPAAVFNNMQAGVLAKVDDSTALLGANTSSGTSLYFQLISVDSALNVSGGTIFTKTVTNAFKLAGLVSLGAGRFFAYGYTGGVGSVCESFIVTVSSGSITFDSSATVGLGDYGIATHHAIFAPDKILLFRLASANASNYTTMATISGNTISYGSSKTFNNGASSSYAFTTAVVDSQAQGKFLFFGGKHNGSGSYYNSAGILSRDESSISYAANSTLVATARDKTDYIRFARLSSTITLMDGGFHTFDGVSASKHAISALTYPDVTKSIDDIVVNHANYINSSAAARLYRANSLDKSVDALDTVAYPQSVLNLKICTLGANDEIILNAGRTAAASPYPASIFAYKISLV